jgi:hypothetical protein
MPEATIQAMLADDSKTFVYLRRQLSLALVDQVAALRMPGVHSLP